MILVARHIIPAILVAASLYTCRQSGIDLGVRERASYKLVNPPPLTALDTRFLRVMTLGHKALYDDFAVIWSLQFLGDPNLKNSTDAQQLNETLLAVIKHHPKIEGFYILSCFVLALDFQRGDLCEPIMIAGLTAFPDSWRIPMTQGFISNFITHDNLKAAAYYQLAASRENTPDYVGRLAQRLAYKGFAEGQDLTETIAVMDKIPGGSRIIEMLQQRGQNTPPPSQQPETNP